jgi:hypothetical protein
MAATAAAMAELRGWMRGDFMGWKLLPTPWKVSGSPINAATERSADTDQTLPNYRLSITSIQVDLGRHRQSMHRLLRQIFGNIFDKQPSVRRSAGYGTPEIASLLASDPRLRGALPIGDMVAYASRSLDQT